MKTNIIILGATGDLAKEKIFPALAQLHKVNNELENSIDLNLITWSRSKPNIIEINSLLKFPVANSIIGSYVDEYLLESFINQNRNAKNIFYLAVPAVVNVHFLDNFARYFTPNCTVILDKPYASDYSEIATLKDIIFKNNLGNHVIFADHFLFKDSLSLSPSLTKFFTGIADADRNKIATIDISLLESEGVGHRLGFYNQTGCINDMLPHLFVLYRLMGMYINSSIEDQMLSGFKINDIVIANSKEYLNENESIKNTQYDIDYRKVPTAFKMLMRRDDHMITLQSGKYLESKISEIVVNFMDGGIMTWNIHPNMQLDYVRDTVHFTTSFNVQKKDHFYLFKDVINDDFEMFLNIDEVSACWELLRDAQNYIDNNGLEMLVY